jgi:hypothetical protein
VNLALCKLLSALLMRPVAQLPILSHPPPPPLAFLHIPPSLVIPRYTRLAADDYNLIVANSGVIRLS